MTRWAVVPAKDFAHAKSRLADVLDPRAREAFARQMLERVLDAVERSAAVDRVAVATDGDEVARLAAARGAEVIVDAVGTHAGLGPIVDRALAHVVARGAEEALVLMADLPGIDADDVRALADALTLADVALAPDDAGNGTNALALRLSALASTQLGHPDSCQRHLAAAHRLELSVRQVRRPGLARDVDTPDDLARLRSALAHG